MACNICPTADVCVRVCQRACARPPQRFINKHTHSPHKQSLMLPLPFLSCLINAPSSPPLQYFSFIFSLSPPDSY